MVYPMPTSTTASVLAGAMLILVAAALWGTSGLSGKALASVADAHPLAIGLYRLAIAGPLLVLIVVAGPGPGALRIPRRHWPAFAVLALSQALYQALYFTAVAAIGVSLATLIALCGAPVLITLLATIVLREPLTGTVLAGVAIAVVGVGLLVGPVGGGEAAAPISLIGLASAGGAALCYAAFALQARTIAPHYPVTVLVAVAFSVGAVMLLPIGVAAGLRIEGPPLLVGGLLAYLGLGATALAYTLFFAGVRRVTATLSGVLVLVEPLTAAMLAWLVFEEALGPAGLVGAGLLLIAVGVLTRSLARGAG